MIAKNIVKKNPEHGSQCPMAQCACQQPSAGLCFSFRLIAVVHCCSSADSTIWDIWDVFLAEMFFGELTRWKHSMALACTLLTPPNRVAVDALYKNFIALSLPFHCVASLNKGFTSLFSSNLSIIVLCHGLSVNSAIDAVPGWLQILSWGSKIQQRFPKGTPLKIEKQQTL